MSSYRELTRRVGLPEPLEDLERRAGISIPADREGGKLAIGALDFEALLLLTLGIGLVSCIGDARPPAGNILGGALLTSPSDDPPPPDWPDDDTIDPPSAQPAINGETNPSQPAERWIKRAAKAKAAQHGRSA